MTFNAASRLRSLEDRSAALGSRRCELPGMHSVPKSAVLPYASGVGGLSRRLLNVIHAVPCFGQASPSPSASMASKISSLESQAQAEPLHSPSLGVLSQGHPAKQRPGLQRRQDHCAFCHQCLQKRTVSQTNKVWTSLERKASKTEASLSPPGRVLCGWQTCCSMKEEKNDLYHHCQLTCTITLIKGCCGPCGRDMSPPRPC